MRYEVVEIVPFVPAIVPLCVRFANGSDVLVVVGDVDGEASDFGGGVDGLSTFEDFGEDFGRGSEIGRPPEPTPMCGVQVESDV